MIQEEVGEKRRDGSALLEHCTLCAVHTVRVHDSHTHHPCYYLFYFTALSRRCIILDGSTVALSY